MNFSRWSALPPAPPQPIVWRFLAIEPDGPALAAGVVDGLARDEPGVMRGQESDDAGRVGRLADPAEDERRARRRFLFGCHLTERTRHRAARPHRVDRDPAAHRAGSLPSLRRTPPPRLTQYNPGPPYS